MTRDEAAREAAQRYVESGAPSSEQRRRVFSLRKAFIAGAIWQRLRDERKKQ